MSKESPKVRRWHEIYERLPKDKKIIGVEVGVWTGKTSFFLLENLPLLKMYMVDAWTDPQNIESFFRSGAKMAKYSGDVYEQTYREVLKHVEAEFGDRAFVMRNLSVEAAKCFNDGLFDLIFIDGDHSYEGVYRDITAWRYKLRPGGLFCGHDYGKGFRGVEKAVTELLGPIERGSDTTWFKIL